MKLKIVKIIIVCLVTLGVMTPALITFGLIFEQHSQLQGLHHLVYEFTNSNGGEHHNPLNHETELQKDMGRLSCSAVNVASQLLTPAQQKTTANLLLIFIFMIFPGSLTLGILLHDRYCIYRNVIFKQKVQMLERLWQQSIQH